MLVISKFENELYVENEEIQHIAGFKFISDFSCNILVPNLAELYFSS